MSHEFIITTTPENSIIIEPNAKESDKNTMFVVNEPSCLDSPSSIKSPTNLSTSFLSPIEKLTKFPIRKLGAAEIIYDYEHAIGNLFISDGFVITSKFNLYSNKNLLFKSIYYWKQIHVLLRSSIYTIEQPKNSSSLQASPSSPTSTRNTRSSGFSTEKYFVYANEDKIQNNDNIQLYKLNIHKDSNNNNNKFNKDQIEKLCHEVYGESFNKEFFDTKNDLLWRIVFIEMHFDEVTQEYNYYLVFTAHHAIVDARNVHFLFAQLMDIIENVYTNPNVTYETNYHCEPSIEERLFNNDPEKLSDIRITMSPDFNGDTTKMLDVFSANAEDKPTTSTKYSDIDLNSVEFVSLQDSYESFTLNDIIKKNYEIKVCNFKLENEFKLLVKKCKENGTKITGCMNVITALATRKLYGQYTNNKDLFNIHYHLLANLRPFLNPPLNNFTAGYWAVVFNLNINMEPEINDETFWTSKFWSLAKHESDSLHERIKNNEHFESAKLDTLLLEQILNGQQFPNSGGVHFALSNLGVMPSSINQTRQVRIKGHYFGTALKEYRWSSDVFHGLATVDDCLTWAIIYNSNSFREDLIDNLVNNILDIIKR